MFTGVFQWFPHPDAILDGLGHEVNAAQAPDRACEDEFATTTEVKPGHSGCEQGVGYEWL